MLHKGVTSGLIRDMKIYVTTQMNERHMSHMNAST